MKPLDLLLVLPLAGPAFGTLNFSNWAPPGPNDFRAPCPAMNSLANHHFINHDGTNITVKELVPIMNQVFNISTELGTIVSSLGLLTADDPASGVFTLNDLNKHNIFEHDASLSRCDFNICGDNHSFNQTIFNEFLSFFNGSEYVTIERAAAARYHLVQKSRAQNPQFTYDVNKQITSYGETIKYFRTMVDPTTKLTSLNFVKILFEQQRLPFIEGWRPPSTEISGFSLASDVLQLALNTPEKYPFSTEPSYRYKRRN